MAHARARSALQPRSQPARAAPRRRRHESCRSAQASIRPGPIQTGGSARCVGPQAAGQVAPPTGCFGGPVRFWKDTRPHASRFPARPAAQPARGAAGAVAQVCRRVTQCGKPARGQLAEIRFASRATPDAADSETQLVSPDPTTTGDGRRISPGRVREKDSEMRHCRPRAARPPPCAQQQGARVPFSACVLVPSAPSLGRRMRGACCLRRGRPLTTLRRTPAAGPTWTRAPCRPP
jgi:hypothetical protein